MRARLITRPNTGLTEFGFDIPVPTNMTIENKDTDAQNRQLPPKRSGLPILGSAVAFSRDPYRFYDDLASHGDIVRFSMGSTDMVAVLHPDDIAQVL